MSQVGHEVPKTALSRCCLDSILFQSGRAVVSLFFYEKASGCIIINCKSKALSFAGWGWSKAALKLYRAACLLCISISLSQNPGKHGESDFQVEIHQLGRRVGCGLFAGGQRTTRNVTSSAWTDKSHRSEQDGNTQEKCQGKTQSWSHSVVYGKVMRMSRIVQIARMAA